MLYTIICIAAPFVLMWLWFTIKATKDPDVQAASMMHMSINDFNYYKKVYEKYWKAIEAEQKGGPIVNPDDFEESDSERWKWNAVRRYLDEKRMQDSRDRRNKMLEEIRKPRL